MSLSAKARQYVIYFFLVCSTIILTFFLYFQTKNEWIVFREAESNFKKKNYVMAAKLYEKSVEEGIPVKKVSLNLAHSYVVLGQFDKAIPLYREHLEKYPKDKQARLSLAKALSWSGNFNEAEAEYKKILELETNKK